MKVIAKKNGNGGALGMSDVSTRREAGVQHQCPLK